ncbi:MAG: signal peptidase I [Oscillospiraceae bacterium]|nr:signal peptidase I [Oscillospiraceae bacterium]
MEEEIKIENIAEEPEKVPEEAAKKPKKSLKAELLDWGKTLILYCLLPLIIFQSLCFMASVPTGSMETTIPVGAQVFTTRTFNKDNIERGDIVVFDSEELGVVLIKRCLGLPGDTVAFDGAGKVYINGKRYYENYVSSFSDFAGEFVVPEDHYFFVGDNRANSLDARYWENPYIHKDDVKGKARFVLFPFSSFGALE